MDIPELETTDQIMEGLVREYIHFNKNFKMIKQINKITIEFDFLNVLKQFFLSKCKFSMN